MHSGFDFLRKAAEGFEVGARRKADKHPILWIAGVIAVAVIICLFSQYPPYSDSASGASGTFSGFEHTSYGHAITWWLSHPFQSVPAETFFHPSAIADKTAAGPISHCDKLAFRPLLPALSSLTHGGYWTLIVANHLAGLLSFGLIYLICLRTTASFTIAVASTWAYAACWSGAWGFNDMIYGDAVAMALLLSALAAGRRSWLVAVLIFAAGFVDERAICAAPLLILFRYWELQPPFADNPERLSVGELRRISLPVLLGVLGYAVCRLYAAHHFNLSTGTSMVATSRMPVYHFYINYPTTLFKVFEFMWLWPLLMLLNLGSAGKSQRRNLLAYLAASLAVALIVLVVWDFDRSIFYLLPSMLAAICFGAGPSSTRSQLALAIMLASLVWILPIESYLGRFLR